MARQVAPHRTDINDLSIGTPVAFHRLQKEEFEYEEIDIGDRSGFGCFCNLSDGAGRTTASNHSSRNGIDHKGLG